MTRQFSLTSLAGLGEAAERLSEEMTKKRGYVSDESQHADEQDIVAPPVVRSRRERAVKARLRNDTAGPSSYTDSGSGDHYSPVNITDTPRSVHYLLEK